MGNLLLHEDSFAWEDSTIDRGDAIMSLNAAITAARTFGDVMYATPTLNDLTVSWGNVLGFLFGNAFDSAQRSQRFPWMTQNQHMTLIYLLGSFQTPSPGQANTIADLFTEFADANNGWAAFERLAEPTVVCTSTWNQWHRDFVIINKSIRYTNYEYYKRFYTEPALQESIGEIQKSITSGKVDASFKRIDQGKIAHEQIHVHFQNDWALNIDGSWKHRETYKHYEIPRRARMELLSWGFLLP